MQIWIKNLGSFSLDQLVNKNQWLNTKYSIYFYIVVPIEKKDSSLYDCDKKVKVNTRMYYLVTGF